MSERKNTRRGDGAAMSAICERCGKPLTLTTRGRLRKDKRFCSASCQQTAIKDGRTTARLDLTKLLQELERHPENALSVARLRRALHVLGMLASATRS